MNDNEYRQLAELEDRLWHFEALHDHVRCALVKHQLPVNAALLDAGCGTGGLLRKLEKWFPSITQVHGMDFSRLAVEFARRRTPNKIYEGSVTALPFPAASYDAIISLDVLCQVERASEALAEFSRCLKPGGLAVVNVPAYEWLWSYHDDAVQSHHRFTRPGLKTLFRDAGLHPVYATYWNTFLFPAIVIRRKLLPPPRDGSSDVREYSPLVSTVLRALLAIERLWLKTGLTLPFGTSVFVVGIRR
jgi:ubiquinone/menaquinone biosynthesis C-methylase UbiE